MSLTDILKRTVILLEGLDRKKEGMNIWVIIVRFRMDENECGKRWRNECHSFV